jgi:hypothetical protein
MLADVITQGCIMDVEELSSRISKLAPTFFKDEDEKKAEAVRHKNKQQKLQERLCRDPKDIIGMESEGYFDCRKEKGKEYLPGVVNRESGHINSLTRPEIQHEDAITMSRVFINRYYQAFDVNKKQYTIWTLPEKIRHMEKYNPDHITIEKLETMKLDFERHAAQILNQLSSDASNRHTRETAKRNDIVFIGIGLSMLTAVTGATAGIIANSNSNSKASEQQLADMGYAQIFIGIVITIVIKVISARAEVHARAARNLDVTLNWVTGEIKRLRQDLNDLQAPHLAKLRYNQPSEIKSHLPVESQLLEMKYLWLSPNRLPAEKSLFESVARLQSALFGVKETPESVEAALFAFKARERQKHGLFEKYTNIEGIAKIYECVIVLICENILPEDAHYQFINEPIKHVADVVGEEKEDEEVNKDEDGNGKSFKFHSVSSSVEPERPIRYMVLYMPKDNEFQPVLAPFGTTWNALKAGLVGLDSAVVTPSELDDTSSSLEAERFSH